MADSFVFEWRVQWGNRVGRAGLANTTLLMKCHVNGAVDCADGFPHHRDVCHADLEYCTPSVFPLITSPPPVYYHEKEQHARWRRILMGFVLISGRPLWLDYVF